MADVEVNSLFERSAEAVREAQITQTGCIHFLMQACRMTVYSFNCYTCCTRCPCNPHVAACLLSSQRLEIISPLLRPRL
jgi:hypothetical protein